MVFRFGLLKDKIIRNFFLIGFLDILIRLEYLAISKNIKRKGC